MKEPPPELIAALVRGEELRCQGPHATTDDLFERDRRNPVAGYYCGQCQAILCGWCASSGVCITCRAVVRSLGAILLLAKENHT